MYNTYAKAQLGTPVVFGTKRIKYAITLGFIHVPLYKPPPPLHIATKYVYSILGGVCDWKGEEPVPALLILYSTAIIWGEGGGGCPLRGGGDYIKMFLVLSYFLINW